MNLDLFRDRKGVHVKLKKDTHAAFRKKLFEHGVSMQKAFNEFARLVSIGDPGATKIVRELIKREVKEQIERLKATGSKRRPEERLDELDQESLYDLIEESDEPV